MRRVSFAGIFVAGVAAGLLIAVLLWVQPRENRTFAQVQAAPTLEPTPELPGDNVYALLDALDQITITLYKRVSPSVVHIASRSQTVSLFYGVVPQEGTGSGFIYDGDGHIVTNNHVINNANEVDVLLSTGITLPAQVVGVDSYYDLAVLHVDLPAGSAAPLEIGDSSGLQVGQSVIAIGNPFGLDRTLTTGVISALERRIETDAGTAIGQAIQTDAAINPGNSGGPLLDMRGRVVGINTAINSPSGGSVGIGFAVPANIIQQVVPSLIQTGHYAHPSLGVQVAELGTQVSVPQGDAVQQGLLIVQLDAGGAGEQSGLQAAQVSVRRGRYVFQGGDIITEVGGKPVATSNDLLLTLEEGYHPGDTVTLTLVRDGNTITQDVVLGSG